MFAARASVAPLTDQHMPGSSVGMKATISANMPARLSSRFSPGVFPRRHNMATPMLTRAATKTPRASV
jgi:hypothetical protein